MRKMFIALLMIGGYASGSALAEPYADKLEIISSTSPMSKMVIEAAKVPDSSSVGIPAYPGARVFQTKGTGEMEVNGKNYKTLAYIKLLSTDPVEKVAAWYKDQLQGYTQESAFGMSIFWKGKGKFNVLDIRQRSTIQNVGVSEALSAMGYDDDMKGAKSVIEVVYE